MTESKIHNAQIETAIKLDKKDFAHIPPQMEMSSGSDIKVSPMAGRCARALAIIFYHRQRHFEANAFL